MGREEAGGVNEWEGRKRGSKRMGGNGGVEPDFGTAIGMEKNEGILSNDTFKCKKS